MYPQTKTSKQQGLICLALYKSFRKPLKEPVNPKP